MFGIINLYKPAGKTSHDMVSFIRKTLGIKRVGHAGTLDPDASGVLPILVGKATALSDLMTEKEKTYIATVRLGIETDTFDISGQVLKRAPVCVTKEEITETVKEFLGEIDQVPPMYSAIKKDGQKLYNLARQGIILDIPPRRVTIYSIRCFDFCEETFKMEVSCSKGTYIRSLCHDLGKKLGTLGTMEALVRTKSGPFTIEEALTPETIKAFAEQGEKEAFLLPPERVLVGRKKVLLPPDAVPKIKNGLRMRPGQLGISHFEAGEEFLLYDENNLLTLSKVITESGQAVLSVVKTFF